MTKYGNDFQTLLKQTSYKTDHILLFHVFFDSFQKQRFSHGRINNSLDFGNLKILCELLKLREQISLAVQGKIW